MLDELPETVRAHDRLSLELHVVNDLRVPVEGLRTVVTAAWEGREDEPFHRVGWAGAVVADAVERVGAGRARRARAAARRARPRARPWWSPWSCHATGEVLDRATGPQPVWHLTRDTGPAGFASPSHA